MKQMMTWATIALMMAVTTACSSDSDETKGMADDATLYAVVAVEGEPKADITTSDYVLTLDNIKYFNVEKRKFWIEHSGNLDKMAWPSNSIRFYYNNEFLFEAKLNCLASSMLTAGLNFYYYYTDQAGLSCYQLDVVRIIHDDSSVEGNVTPQQQKGIDKMIEILKKAGKVSDYEGTFDFDVMKLSGSAKYEELPKLLTGRWHMVKSSYGFNGQKNIAPGEVVITLLDNGLAVVDNKDYRQYHFLSSGNYPYHLFKERLTIYTNEQKEIEQSVLSFNVGGYGGSEKYDLELTQDGILCLGQNMSSDGPGYYFLKEKHDGPFADINYDELNYLHTWRDTVYIASHVFYEHTKSGYTPFYLIRHHAGPQDHWSEFHAEIMGFQHEEGYEVKAVLWHGMYGGGCLISYDHKLVEILEKQQKQSEHISDYYWGRSYPGWAD